MTKDQEYISGLIDDFEKFWEGWEFATQSNKPRLFNCIHESLNEYHELLLTTQQPKDTE